ncbi:MAG: ABC transporter ATP-binding protein, partial [Clostridia bacterium]|nr:ABC transporter ATP-binding protein [Clostridia bacterium]
MIKKLLKGAKGYEKFAILTVVLVLLETALEVVLPMFMSNILNSLQSFSTNKGLVANITYLEWSAFEMQTIYKNAIVTSDVLIDVVITYGVLMVISSAISLTFGGLAGYYCAMAGAGFSKNMRASLFNKVQEFSFANVDKLSTASLVTRCTTDVNHAQQSFMMLIRTVFRAPSMLIFSTIMAFINQPQMAWVFLIAVPLLGIVMAFLATKVHPYFRTMFKKYDKMNATVQENLTAIRVVKAFVRDDFEEQKYEQATEDVRQHQFKAESIMILMNPLTSTVMYGTMIALILIGGTEIAHGTMAAGTLSAMMSYATQILSSVMMICFIAVQLVMSRASIDRIYEVLETEPTITDGPSDAKVESGSIVFNNVSFSYTDDKDNPTLENINLTINSGESVGIIGGTGDGKSSLVHLIPRFYDVMQGEVLVDGRNVKDYTLYNLREGVSMVLQKNVLFSGTIKDNLLWGNENATDEEIALACKYACADEFINSFPDGYLTDLGQGGVNVSGGQKQRLCIA